MKFREAKIDDLSQLLDLEQRVVEAERPFNASIKPENVKYYDIENLIFSTDSCLLVAEDANGIVASGYAQIRQSKTSLIHEVHSYLGFMYVNPNCRGKGINKTLVENLVAWSKGKGVRDIYLDVYAENAAALRAYGKVGFEPSMLEMKLKL